MGALYSKNLAEFIKEQIMEMCPKDVVIICVPRRDDDNRIMGPPIIELEFEKNTMEPHINNWWRKHPTFASTTKNSTRPDTRKYMENIQYKSQSRIKLYLSNMMHTLQRKH